MALHPTSELVAIAWLANIPGLPVGGMATSIPKQEDWPVGDDNISRFVSVRVVGGSPLRAQAPVANPVLEFSTWACRLESNKPPWHAAAQMAEIIRVASYERAYGVYGVALHMNPGGRQYANASVMGVTLHTEPRRMYADPRNYAHYQFDASMTWKEAGLLIP